MRLLYNSIMLTNVMKRMSFTATAANVLQTILGKGEVYPFQLV